jgi:twinkle protein
MNFADLGIKTRKSAGEEQTLCPTCSHTRKKKTHPCLSVNHDKGIWHCNHCGWKGSLNKDYSLKKQLEPVKLPPLNYTELSENSFKWLNETRKITAQVIRRNKITDGKHYMPQEKAEMNTIQFNYFERGELVNVKYRDAKKNFTQVKDAKKVFYKIDDVVGNDYVIICEGEIDALSFEVAGYVSAISVPDGAIKTDNEYSAQKLQYIDNCIEYFTDVKKIYLATDNDEAGLCLRRELARRLGKEKCFIVDLSPFKDANECLVAEGAESLSNRIKEAKEYPIDGVHSISDYEDRVLDLYHNGFPESTKLKQITDLNDYLTWWRPCLITVTGIPSHGKSTFIDQCIVLLIQQGWRFAIYSPEHQSEFHIQRLARMVIGRPFFGADKMSVEQLRQAMDWLRENIFFIEPPKEENSEGATIDYILTKSRELVARKGVNSVIIDNWGTIEHNYGGLTETQYIQRALNKINLFKLTYEMSVVLVAHPTKMKKENGKFEVPNLYSINGSAYFYNKTDVGLVVYRNEHTEIHVEKVKFEGIYGRKGTAFLNFHEPSSRYYNAQSSINLNPFPQKTEQIEHYINKDLTDLEPAPF